MLPCYRSVTAGNFVPLVCTVNTFGCVRTVLSSDFDLPCRVLHIMTILLQTHFWGRGTFCASSGFGCQYTTHNTHIKSHCSLSTHFGHSLGAPNLISAKNYSELAPTFCVWLACVRSPHKATLLLLCVIVLCSFLTWQLLWSHFGGGVSSACVS